MSKFKQNTIEKVKVIFRKFPDGEIIALFPELPGDMKVGHCLSYLHNGQHGCADTSIYYNTKSCHVQQYYDLMMELLRIGYSLQIVSRFSYQMDQKRIAEIRQMNANYNKIPSDNVEDYAPEK